MGKKTGSGGEKSRVNWQVGVQFCLACGKIIKQGLYCDECKKEGKENGN